MLGIGIIVPVLPVLAINLGATAFWLAMITAVFSLARGLLQPIVGSLSDRWGRKGFLVLGLFIYGVVGLLIPLATQVPHLIAIRLLQGVGAAMIVPVAMAYAGAEAKPGEEGQTMSRLNAAMFCGIGCGPVIGGFCADLWGMDSVFHIMAVLSFIAFALVMLNMPATLPTQRITVSLLANFRLMCTRRRTVGILLARFATVLMIVPVMAFLPMLMAGWSDRLNLYVGLIIACRTLMSGLCQFLFGHIADQYNKISLLLIGTVCIALSLLLIPPAHNLGLLVGAYLLLGVGEAVCWSVLGAYAAEEGRRFGHGAMMGVFNLALSAGVFTGAVNAGIIVDYLSLPQSFQLTAAAIVLCMLLSVTCIRSGEANGERADTGDAPPVAPAGGTPRQ
jgi:DHA1 family multidrug resistance protein-like MFS transporter